MIELRKLCDLTHHLFFQKYCHIKLSYILVILKLQVIVGYICLRLRFDPLDFTRAVL